AEMTDAGFSIGQHQSWWYHPLLHVSRNARKFEGECALSWIGCVAVLLMAQLALVARAGQPPERGGAAGSAKAPSRVVVVDDPLATEAFKPDADRVRQMTQRAITKLTGLAKPGAAWASLVSPKDVVGIKVYSSPGPDSGTRPAVVAAIVE